MAQELLGRFKKDKKSAELEKDNETWTNDFGDGIAMIERKKSTKERHENETNLGSRGRPSGPMLFLANRCSV